MAKQPEISFADYLPAVLLQDATGEAFLRRFLRAFEVLFAGIQAEMDGIPDLFAVAPTPALRTAAEAGTTVVELDSAAGLRAGDVAHFQDVDPDRVEFAEAAELPSVAADLLPTTLALTQPLRFAHPRATPLARVGPPGKPVTLDLPAPSGEQILTIVQAGKLGLTPGDALQVDTGDAREYAQVFAVEDSAVTIRPALTRAHEVGRPVAVLRALPTATPPPAFRWAAIQGPELVLRTAALEGDVALETDTYSGLRPGDLLAIGLKDADSSGLEFARVADLPPESSQAVILRDALRLSHPLRSSHDVGVSVSGLAASDDIARLAQEAVVGAGALAVDQTATLDVVTGDVLAIGIGELTEYIQVQAVSEGTIQLASPLATGHGSGEPVVRMAPRGSGTAFLGWLAGWIGLELRPDRGERWNRELLRLAGRIWPHRGTRAGVEAYLNAYLRGEALATLYDLANPMQIGLVSTIGTDTVICGDLPYAFRVDLVTNERNSRLYHPDGIAGLSVAAHVALGQEKPAHTYYDLRLQAHTMQIGVDAFTEVGARVGDTTLLWDQPIITHGNR